MSPDGYPIPIVEDDMGEGFKDPFEPEALTDLDRLTGRLEEYTPNGGPGNLNSTTEIFQGVRDYMDERGISRGSVKRFLKKSGFGHCR